MTWTASYFGLVFLTAFLAGVAWELARIIVDRSAARPN
jgi:hypothetical protein